MSNPAPIGTGLLNEAKNAYNTLTKSWIEFALVLSKLNRDGIWTSLGYENFSDLYSENFPGLTKHVCCKFLRIAQDYSDVELRKCKTGSYDVLYDFAVHRGAFTASDFTFLKKKILAGDVTRAQFRAMLRDKTAFREPTCYRISLSRAEVGTVIRTLRKAEMNGLALKIKSQTTGKT